MKKILFALLLFVFGAMTVSAEAPTGKALTFQNQVKSYLQSEGYMPEIDKDGDIHFKTEGRNIYIALQNWGSGVYMDMYFILGLEDSNISKVRRAADDAQKSLKFVRVDVMSEEQLTIDVVQYFSSFNDFKENFKDFLDIIMKCRQRTLDNYNN